MTSAAALPVTAYPMGSIHHPALGPINYEATEISDDPDTQVAQTTCLMARHVREDCASPEILTDAAEASRATDPAQIAADCWAFVRGRLGFVNDNVTAMPFNQMFKSQIVETLVRPRDMSSLCRAGVHQRTGDCDDFSMYLAALLMAHGIPCKFVTVAADAQDPARYSHVYVAAYPNGQRLALDASHGQYAGWEAPNRYGKRAEWDVAQAFPWMLILSIAAVVAAWGLR